MPPQCPVGYVWSESAQQCVPTGFGGATTETPEIRMIGGQPFTVDPQSGYLSPAMTQVPYQPGGFSFEPNIFGQSPFGQGGLGVIQPPSGMQTVPFAQAYPQLFGGGGGGGGGDPYGGQYLQLAQQRFAAEQQQAGITNAINAEQNAISRFSAQAQAAYAAGNLEVGQRNQWEAERHGRTLEELERRRLQLEATMQPARLGLEAAVNLGSQNLQRAQFLQQALTSPSNVFSSFFLSRGEAPPSNDMFGLNQLPGAGQPFFGLLDQLPPWQSFVPNLQGIGGPLPQYSPQPFSPIPDFGGTTGGGVPSQSQVANFGTLSPEIQQRLLSLSPADRQAFIRYVGGGAPSMQKGGLLVTPEPIVGMGLLTGIPRFTAGEDDPELIDTRLPGIIDVTPLKAKNLPSFQRGGRAVTGAEGLRALARAAQQQGVSAAELSRRIRRSQASQPRQPRTRSVTQRAPSGDISGAEGLAALGRAFEARQQLQPTLRLEDFVQQVNQARQAGQQLLQGGTTGQAAQQFAQARQSLTGQPITAQSLGELGGMRDQALLENLVRLRTIGAITNAEFGRSANRIQEAGQARLQRAIAAAQQRGRLGGLYEFGPTAGSPSVESGFGRAVGSFMDAAQRTALQNVGGGPFSPSLGQPGEIPEGIPDVIRDLLERGFPAFPFLMDLATGSSPRPMDFGAGLQGIPMPSPQFFSGLTGSENAALGNFFPTVLGMPYQDVLQASLMPFQGLRQATPGRMF